MELGTADKSSIYIATCEPCYPTGAMKCSLLERPHKLLTQHWSPARMIALRRLCLQWPFSLYCTLFSHHDHKRLYNFLADQTSCQVLALSMQMTKAQNVLRVATGWLLVTVFILRTLYRMCLLKKSVSYWIGNEGYGVCMQKAII